MTHFDMTSILSALEPAKPAPPRKPSRPHDFNRAVWHKLGRKQYRQEDVRTHTNRPTGYYRLRMRYVDQDIAMRFLRQHRKCVAVGKYVHRWRLAQVKRIIAQYH